MFFSGSINECRIYETNFLSFDNIESTIERIHFKAAKSSVLFADEYIFSFGGISDNGTPINDLYKKNRETPDDFEKISTSGDIPQPRYGHTCGFLRNQMVILGGTSGDGSTLVDVFTLDLKNFVWKYKGVLDFGIASANSIKRSNKTLSMYFPLENDIFTEITLNIGGDGFEYEIVEIGIPLDDSNSDWEVVGFDDLTFCIAQKRIYLQKKAGESFAEVSDRVSLERIRNFSRVKQSKMKEEYLFPMVIKEIKDYVSGRIKEDDALFCAALREIINSSPIFKAGDAPQRRGKLSTWWHGESEEKYEREIGEVIYMGIELFYHWVRAFYGENPSEETKQLQHFANVIGFVVGCTSDKSHERSFYAELFLDKDSGSFNRQSDVIQALWSLDSPDVIYKTVASTREFNDLPDAFRILIKRLVLEFISARLATNFEYGSFDVDDGGYLSVQRRISAIVRPILNYTNPITLVNGMLKYFFFSAVGRRVMKPVFKIDVVEREIKELKASNEEIIVELTRIEEWIAEQDILKLRSVNDKLKEVNQEEILKTVLVDNNLFMEVELEEYSDEILNTIEKMLRKCIFLMEKKFLFDIMRTEEFRETALFVSKSVLPFANMVYGYIDFGDLMDAYIEMLIKLNSLVQEDTRIKEEGISEKDGILQWNKAVDAFLNDSVPRFYSFYQGLIEADYNEKRIIYALSVWTGKISNSYGVVKMSEIEFLDLIYDDIDSDQLDEMREATFRARVARILLKY